MKILKPESLLEKQLDGRLIPSVWYSHSFYSNETTAREKAEQDIRADMERVARKKHENFDVTACLERCKAIEVNYL